MLDSLKEFHELCEQYDLKYCLAGGTMLGAIRHNGFIPWDDDVDVVMPRVHYEKLKTIQNAISSPFELKVPCNSKGYIYPFLKFVNNECIVEEEFEESHVCGVWIDIFPLDVEPKGKLSASIILSLINFLRKVKILKFKSYKKVEKNSVKAIVLKFCSLVCMLLPDFLVQKSIETFAQLRNESGNNSNLLINYYGAYGKRDVAEYSIFNERKLYHFEGLELFGPGNYDSYLSHIYGDYMKLPPKEKRKGHHFSKIVFKDNNRV